MRETQGIAREGIFTPDFYLQTHCAQLISNKSDTKPIFLIFLIAQEFFAKNKSEFKTIFFADDM